MGKDVKIAQFLPEIAEKYTWLRSENQAMFCHFCHLGKTKNPSEVVQGLFEF